ncbi:MAG: hypothetical protein HRU07_06920 [Nitrosopumilus sp.]|nr:hypothetical protein [Nitrosopumilus sp.]NRA05871.1 hypothetical protein [Nitrosopumilus sp.]
MPDNFAIYHNSRTDIKIHNICCSAFDKRDPNTINEEWHTTPDLQTATDIARTLSREHGLHFRNCKRCKPSST